MYLAIIILPLLGSIASGFLVAPKAHKFVGLPLESSLLYISTNTIGISFITLCFLFVGFNEIIYAQLQVFTRPEQISQINICPINMLPYTVTCEGQGDVITGLYKNTMEPVIIKPSSVVNATTTSINNSYGIYNPWSFIITIAYPIIGLLGSFYESFDIYNLFQINYVYYFIECVVWFSTYISAGIFNDMIFSSFPDSALIAKIIIFGHWICLKEINPRLYAQAKVDYSKYRHYFILANTFDRISKCILSNLLFRSVYAFEPKYK